MFIPFLQRTWRSGTLFVGLHFPFEINDSTRNSWREMNPGSFGSKTQCSVAAEVLLAYFDLLRSQVLCSSVGRPQASRITQAGREVAPVHVTG